MKFNKILGFAAGPLGAAILGLIAIPLSAWIFSPADLGRYNVFQVSLSFILLFTTLGLDRAYIREYHEAQDRDRLFRSCFSPGFLLLAVIVAFTIPFSSRVAQWLFAVPDGTLYIVTVFAFFSNYISRFLSLILRMQERGWAYSASQVMPKLLSLSLIAGVALSSWDRDFKLLQWIMFLSILVVMVIYGWNTRRQWMRALKARIDFGELHRLLVYGFPLACAGLAYWGLTATSTMALRQWSTFDELAVYSVTNSVAGVGMIFQAIFATVWAPTVYKWVADGVDMKKVDDVARHALLAVCVIFVTAGLFSWLLDLLLPQHYHQIKYLIACAVAPSLLYTLSEITTVGITISRRTSWTVWITLVALATNVCLSWWLVPSNGAAGAILANAVAFMVFFVLRTEVSAALWRGFPRARIYAFLCLMVSLSMGIVVARQDLPKVFPAVWIAPLLLVLVYFPGEIQGVLSLARKRLSK